MRMLLTVLLSGFLAGSVHGDSEYTFRLAGDAINAKVLPVTGARKGAAAAGDIARVGEFPIVLQQPGAYQFRIGGAQKELLYATIDDGVEQLVAVVVRPPTLNPLRALSAEERKQLWGVHLETIPSDWEKSTIGVDWSKTLLSISETAPPLVGLSELPPDLRYLALEFHSALTAENLALLKPLTDLLYLSLTFQAETSFSASLLRGATKLHNLEIKNATLTNLDTLAGLTALRFVKLRELEGLDSVNFAKSLPELRVLKIDGTAVDDLRPLAGSKNLRLLSANATKVTALPTLAELPALRDLRLHSTPVAQDKKLLAPYRAAISVSVKNWDPSIKGFEAHDAQNPPPEKPVLFIGSSSIRMWDLKKSFPKHATLNRGFGGSELSDSLRYFDRIVLPYRPKAILLYAGDNDIAQGETAPQVVADYVAFAARVRRQLPDADFAYIPIKPSLARLGLWEEMNKANLAIQELTTADPKLHYLDIATPMMGNNHQPKWDLFLNDGLHLNEEGYKLWNAVVGPWLDSL